MELKTETHDTGVIYKITNLKNGMIYVGQAESYVNNGINGICYYGVAGRWRWHIGNINSQNPKRQRDCPYLYEAIVQDGEENFEHEVIEVCLKTELDAREEYHIRLLESHLTGKGYNYWIGNKKPEDPERLTRFLSQKENCNRGRAKDGQMKRNPFSIGLPGGISPVIRNGKHVGYNASIKIKGEHHFKSFGSSQYTMEEKLEIAKQHLEKIKLENNIS